MYYCLTKVQRENAIDSSLICPYLRHTSVGDDVDSAAANAPLLLLK